MNPPTLQFILKMGSIAALMILYQGPSLAQGDTLVSFWGGYYTPNIVESNFTVTNLTEGPGITFYECADYVAADGFDQPTAADGLANGDYWEFTITPDPGYSIDFNWLEVQHRASMNPNIEVNTLGTVYWKIGNGPWTQSNITARVDPKPTNFCSCCATRRPHYPNFLTTQPITFRIVRYIYDNDQYNFSRITRNGYTWVSGIVGTMLPVELTNFTANAKHDKVLLEWTTSSETNNQGFEIQHSTDGQNWKNSGFVEGHGTSTETHQYTFIDEQALPGHNYYRLKQIDFDQEFSYSDVKEVMFDHQQKALIQVYPNPSYSQFTLSLFNPNRERGLVKLVSSTGRLIWERQFNHGEIDSFWTKEFNLPQEGLYFVHTQIGKAIEVEKVVVIDRR